jgi:hypothetical protein
MTDSAKADIAGKITVSETTAAAYGLLNFSFGVEKLFVAIYRTAPIALPLKQIESRESPRYTPAVA